MPAESPGHTPLVLLVDDQEWTSRSIESLLQPKGYAVVRAYTGRQALDLIEKMSPDAIMVDFQLPDIDGIDVSRACLASPNVKPATPILMMSNGSLGRAQRLDALGAGVWDILRHPLDPRELVLRLGTFVNIKQRTDRLQEEGLTDPDTGFYNARGLLRRAREISADAGRLQRPVACLAIGGDLMLDGQVDSEGVFRTPDDVLTLAEALRVITRTGDTVGKLPSGEFVVVAPGADDDGVLRVIQRLNEFLATRRTSMTSSLSFDPAGQGGLRAGYHIQADEERLPPEELLQRATRALRRAQVDTQTQEGFLVRAYEA